MISKFIRELQRYTRENLIDIFECSDADIVRIIKKLKGYGILKTVKYLEEEKNMSDLVEEDEVVVDEDDSQSKCLYVFAFVGIIIVEGRVLKCYPKYLKNNNEPKSELTQIMKVLRKYNPKEQIIRMYNDGGNVTSFNRLAVIVYLLNDYFENGIYTNTQDIIETNGMGEIHWDKTINGTYPIMQDNRPYYVELQTKRRINDDEDFFKRLHECVLTECTKELKGSDLLDILGVEGAELTDEILKDLGDDDYILTRLEKELNVQFNTRKQILLKTIEALILNKSTIDDIDSFSMYGTNSFNLVWENICAEILDNQLKTSIKDLEIDDVRVPENATYKKSDELISVIEKPTWFGFSESGSSFSKKAEQTLIPDLISIHKTKNTCDFIIFDAKYYSIHLIETEPLRGQPGIGDVTKQYLYQLAYKDFIKANKIDKVRNCFLMPTEEEGEDGIIKKGSVRMDMLAALELEDIQVRQLSATNVYRLYLSGQKLDIGKLDL